MTETPQAAPGGKSTLLQKKLGPLPVWLWALMAAGLVYAYSRYKANKTAATTAATDTAVNAAQSADTAPEFIIENNEPAGAYSRTPVTTPTPVSTPTGASAPVTTPAPGPILPVNTRPPSTTPQPPVASKPIPVGVHKPPVGTPKKAPIVYRVQHGDTLSSIAARHHTTWQKLWAYNTTPGNRPANTIATLKQRGPNTLFAGEEIDIPQ